MTDESPHALVHLSDTDLTLADEADYLRGRNVVDPNGDDVGDVEDLVIDPDDRRVRFLQVGSGGLLGLEKLKQLIPIDVVVGVDDGAVHIGKPREYVARSPAYDPRLFKQIPDDERLYGYWGHRPV